MASSDDIAKFKHKYDSEVQLRVAAEIEISKMQVDMRSVVSHLQRALQSINDSSPPDLQFELQACLKVVQGSLLHADAVRQVSKSERASSKSSPSMARPESASPYGKSRPVNGEFTKHAFSPPPSSERNDSRRGEAGEAAAWKPAQWDATAAFGAFQPGAPNGTLPDTGSVPTSPAGQSGDARSGSARRRPLRAKAGRVGLRTTPAADAAPMDTAPVFDPEIPTSDTDAGAFGATVPAAPFTGAQRE